ncbi:MAG: hypothetical protein MUE84_17120 [Hyphomonas sp.]|jgi:hypothetical protein|nr:hypothetical protein [Hyphomonas sp.]
MRAIAVLAGFVLWPVTPVAAEDASISSELVDRLCPFTGQPGLVLGATLQAQPAGLERSLRNLPPESAPFTRGQLELTPWSRRIAAITYSAPHTLDPDQAEALRTSVYQALTAVGWQETEVNSEQILPLNIVDKAAFERIVPSSVGPQKLLLEFAIDGSIELRCGDPQLLILAQQEREGRLEPGATRPVAPPYDETKKLPDAAICQTQRLQQFALAQGGADEFSPEFVDFGGAAFEESERSGHGERVKTWLEWKLLRSGKITEDRLNELHKPYLPLREAGVESMMQMLVHTVAFGEARERGDGQAACEAMRQVILMEHARNRTEIVYWEKVNTALEGEAKRLGVALD